ncbi:MAG: DUF1206 domain-containing protein [Spirochaetales bacterium]
MSTQVEHAVGQGVSKGKWISARVGHVAKGVVYVVMGAIAFQAAIGQGQATGSTGALQQIAQEPFGQVLLVLVGIGLFAYLIWRLIQAIADVDNKGTDGKGVVKRIGFAISGLVHGALGYTAFTIALGRGGGGGGSTQSMTAQLMSQPFGRWLVAIVGLIVFGYGVYAIVKGAKKKFARKLAMSRMKVKEAKWALRVGMIGLIARGVVFGIMGVFFFQAALSAQPGQARGIGGALRSLLQQPYGPWLLGAVAIGLIAYGIYMGVVAKYRKIPAG